MKPITIFLLLLATGLLLAAPSLALQSSPGFQFESDSDSDSEQPDNAERWSSFSDEDGERHASTEEMMRLDSIVRRHRRDMDATNRDSFAGHTTVGGPSSETTDDQYQQRRQAVGLASIIGRDTRVPVRIGKLTSMPASAVGLLRGSGHTCTAFLVGPYHAVTAAHCVYDFPRKRWISKGLKFWPGISCSLYNRQALVARAVRAKTDYVKRGESEADFAYILFKKPATKLEFLPFGYWYPKPGNELSIYGYPSDKRCSGRGGVNSKPMYSTTCSHTTSKALNSGRRLRYKCDTKSGMSGSPILSKSSFGKLAAYCVHTTGDGGYRYNYGAMINFHRFWELVEWIRSTGYNIQTEMPKGIAPVY